MLSPNITPFPTLSTERLVLRPLERADAGDIYAHRADEQVNKYLDGFRHTSIEETLAFIQRVQNEVAANKTILWVLTLKGNNTFMGTICLWNILKEEYKAEIGYTMCTHHHGKGYMAEAMAAIINFAFRKTDLRIIEAFTHKNNARSISLLLKHNFKQGPLQSVPGKNNRVVFHLAKESMKP